MVTPIKTNPSCPKSGKFHYAPHHILSIVFEVFSEVLETSKWSPKPWVRKSDLTVGTCNHGVSSEEAACGRGGGRTRGSCGGGQGG